VFHVTVTIGKNVIF